jgi:hypothetical protein
MKEHGLSFFKKKILGVYAYKKEALKKEIRLHLYFDVKNNSYFFNRANQTSSKFEFDNTGRIQSDLSNRKRSAKLKN